MIYFFLIIANTLFYYTQLITVEIFITKDIYKKKMLILILKNYVKTLTKIMSILRLQLKDVNILMF